MNKLIKSYIKNDLAPFSLTIGWNTTTNKKELVLPFKWVDVNIKNYKEHINKDIIKSKKEEVINLNNCLGLKMGTTTQDNYKIIGLDIDNKEDKDDIFNGVKKWKELLKEHNINNCVSFNTFIQQTGNCGFHYLFKVSNEQYENIKNITNLKIDSVSYCIDVKANENSFLVVEPSNYYDDKGTNKYYCWLKNDNIDIIPEWIYDLIRVKKPTIKTELKEANEQPIINNNTKINNVDNINELETIKPLFKLLKKERVNAFDKWFIIACLIKSLYGENGLELLLELSRGSKLYETDEWIIKKYKEITKRSFTINSFYYFLKKDNPDAYQKHLKARKEEKILNDTIEINKEYLLDIDDNLDKDTILNNKIDELFNDNNIKSFNLKSPYDTGKTQLIKKILNKYQPKKVLWVSYRISLTNDIKGNFKQYGFKSYLDGFNYNSNKLIIQLESLLNLTDGFIDEQIDVPSYDLVIIDEIESVLSQFNSPTFNGKSKDTFILLEEIINNSKKLITLDGDTSNRTYNYINNFGNSINIINTIKKNPKTFLIINEYNNFCNEIFKELDENKKIAIVSQGRVKADNYYKLIKSKYPTLKILLYTSYTDDSEKMKLDDVNNIWDKCDVLIYSPTIEAGVNFDKPHFNKIFGVLSDMSTSQRSFIQMLNRIRKTTDNEIILENVDGHNKQLFKLNKITEFYNFYDAEQQARKLKSFQKEVLYKNVDGKRKRIENYDNYSINYLYNLVEEGNKQKYYFMAKFKDIIESKGHTISFNDVSEIIKLNESIELNVNEDEIINKELENKFDEIANINLIDNNEYSFLMNLKAHNKASEIDKIKITKKYFCDILRTTELNRDDIKFWYYNTHLIKNYNNLLDIETFKKTNELNNNIAFEKLELVKDILNKLGFDKIDNNNKYIQGSTLTTNFNKLTEENKLFTNKKASMLFFKVRPFKTEKDKEPTIKQILGHLNSILDNYSIKIENKQIQINSKREYVYYIKVLNDVDEIMRREKI